MKPVFADGLFLPCERFHRPVKVLEVNIGVRLFIIFAAVSRFNESAQWCPAFFKIE